MFSGIPDFIVASGLEYYPEKFHDNSKEVRMKVFESPPRKIIPFLHRSREKLRAKYRVVKVNFRNLERKHRYTINKMEKYKEELSKLQFKLQEEQASKKNRNVQMT